MKQDNVWIVIPAYNEEKNIEKIMQGVKLFFKNILVVDDGSKDKTYEIASRYAKVIKLPKNRGKGFALRKGCDYVKSKAEIIIVMDSDGQHKPEDIPRLLKPLEEVDIVFASRKINKNMPFVFRFGNCVINNISSMLNNIKLHDTQSGFRAFRTCVYDKIRWKSNDYSMESEMIYLAGKNKLRYKEIFIDTIYLDKNKGTTVLDGIKIVLDIIGWKLK